ncbi:breast carcinoma-amplified sequence 1 isoform X2 [Pimephales promelas]|uniref:breast carcinoma-amplified sequence 1 isoform X2 n=1 Tax=Pimephales promelas TaxID=90988 RepID=UPI001955A04E|nr:breast carcinoma-amplified sequence 1 isoform X2 [Pimephales promelas]
MGNEQSTQKRPPKTNAEKKVKNGDLNGHAVPNPDGTELVASKTAAVEQKSEPPPVTIKNEPKPPKKEEVDGCKLNGPAHVATTPEQKTTIVKNAEPPKTVPKPSEDEVTTLFGKMFKKKSEPVKPALESNDSVDALVDLKIDLQPDPVDIKTSTQPEPEGETLEPCPVEVTEENHPSEDIKATEKTVMNFFKTFVTPTKTSKEAKATPDASKEQSQKETPPAPPTNAQETPKAPPPPPPAPPKMESKAEPVVKKEETSATKAAAAASAKAEGSAKTKTKDSSFSKLFRPKPVVVEEKKPVEVQVDASKSSTLEASAKPEEPPAPKPEEKKQEKKSTFGNMFKPKVLLGQVNSRIQAAASSAAASISLMSARSAPEAKKETPAPPPVAEAAPVVKAKEEPKPAVPAPQTAPDNKSIGSTDNSSPNMPRKLEKRNSLQLFFKNLGQKRQSDAGMQTDPVAPEKSK